MFDNTFETETDLERITLHINDGTHRVVTVSTFERGIAMVRDYLSMGIASRLVVERAYYCKNAWSMSQDGEWQYKYFLVWRQVN